ncbi:MAG TPA: hypothetical protein VMA77_32630 [Solirubrobacteraceae bacterium]|nr:hypothetical protein [Solirubrobacteraceae bacterium]
MTPAPRTRSDGSANIAQERMLKKLTDELGGLMKGVQSSTSELVNAVTALADRVLRESEEARELVREDRAEFYRVLREENALVREAAAEAAERHSREALAALQDRRPDAALPMITSVADEYDATERLEQRELVLSYMAWLTLLGRAGVASVFLAQRMGGAKGGSDGIQIYAAPFEQMVYGWTLVVTLDGGKALTGSVTKTERPPVVVPVPYLRPETQIRRLEICDERGNPLYLGIVTAVQVQHRQSEPGPLEAARAYDEDR